MSSALRILIFVIGAAGSLPAAASLSLDQVLDSVDRHYPEILAVDAQARAQDFLVTRARGAFDPNLSAAYERTVDGTYPNEQFRVGARGQIPGTPLKYGGEWDQLNGKVPIYQGGEETGTDGRVKAYVELPLLRDLIIDRARAGVQTALFKHSEFLERARLARLNTYRIAALSYWVWIASVEKQKTYESLLSVAQQRDTVIRTRVARGQSPRIDQVDNQRIIAQRKAQLEKSRLEVQKATLALSLFFRTEEGAPKKASISDAPAWLSSTNTLPVTDPETMKSALNRHPNLTTLQQVLEQRKVDQKLAKYSVLPRLDASARQVEYLGEPPGARTDGQETIFGLTFSIPLFNRDARGNAGAMNLEVVAAEQRLKLAEQRLTIDFEETILESRTASEIYRLVSDEFEFASQVETAERKRFQEGDSSLLNVNLREQDAILARLRAIDALLDVRDRDLELKLLTNTWVRTY